MITIIMMMLSLQPVYIDTPTQVCTLDVKTENFTFTNEWFTVPVDGDFVFEGEKAGGIAKCFTGKKLIGYTTEKEVKGWTMDAEYNQTVFTLAI